MNHRISPRNAVRRVVMPAAVIAAAMAIAAPGSVFAAPIVVSERDSTHLLSFSDTSAFSDAATKATSVYTLSGSSTTGDTLSLNYTVPHGSTGFTATTSADFGITAPSFTVGSPNDTYAFTVSALDPASTGTLTEKHQLAVNVAPPGGDGRTFTGITGGYHYLEDDFNPTGNQSAGAKFTFTEIIPGNYSTVGVGTGDHELLNINGAWAINQNFVYNGTDTIFAASISNYNPTTDQINLQYQIYGSPVPLPASVWLMLGGFGALVIFARKRDRAGEAVLPS